MAHLASLLAELNGKDVEVIIPNGGGCKGAIDRVSLCNGKLTILLEKESSSVQIAPEHPDHAIVVGGASMFPGPPGNQDNRE